MDILTHQPTLSELTPPAEAAVPGWRETPVQRADGTWDLVLRPLTLEEVLHPQLGDIMSQSLLHVLMVTYLLDVFRARAATIPGMLVMADAGVFWDDPELQHHYPDISVIPNVRDRDTWMKDSFSVAEEGTRPCLIVELVSPPSRSNDVDKKFQHYYQAGVEQYVILDRRTESSPWKLCAYERGADEYVPATLSAEGQIWLPAVELWLGVDGQQVVCFDRDRRALGNYAELAAALQRAEVQRERIEVERDLLAARVRELEAKLAERGEPGA